MSSAIRNGTFTGKNVFLSRSLVPPELYPALHDALRLNGANVFLCSDPTRNSPLDFHVISSPDHDKFEDLRAKGCNLLGPQCVLSCAKEHRDLPKQGYTCCLAMDGVKVFVSGFSKDEKGKIEKRVTAMGGVLVTKASLDVNFVIVKNVLATKYRYALNFLKKPIVNLSWLSQCWTEHRVVPQEPFRILPFTGLTICVTRIPLDERKEIEKLIIQNGGSYSSDLTKQCTHLISDAPVGDKFLVARRWGNIHIVTRKWVDQSIAKRGCLDERLYCVNEGSKSCNGTKGLPKEPCYQEISLSHSSLSKTEDLEASLSCNGTKGLLKEPCYQDISLSQSALSKPEDIEARSSQNTTFYSDANAIPREDTIAPTEHMKDEAKCDSRIVEDSETEDNDLYLSNCRIFLVAFEENEQSKLVNMIRSGGGTRYMYLSEKLTHIILGTPSEIEKREVRRLAAWGVIHVVRATWLEECDQAKREVPVSPRHNFYDLQISKGVSEDKLSASELILEKRRGTEKSENFPSRSSLEKVVSKSEHSKLLDAVNSVKKEKCKLQSASGTTDPLSGISSSTFRGRSFYFSSSFPMDRRPEIIEWIQQGGGAVVDNPRKMNVDFLVECHGLLHLPVNASKSTIVSTHWIRSSLEEGSMQDVGSHILYSPLRCHIPLPGFEGLCFCVSQYEEKDRILLRNLCFTLGAKFKEKLIKRKVTHLLCKFSNGPKYEAACNWGIQPVTAEWITECIAKDMMVSPDSFRPRPVTTQDKEAGLCTVSQYPTQAAYMASACSPSQMLSESLGTANSLKETFGALSDKFGEKPEDSRAHMKRLRLRGSNCDNDATKKYKMPQDIRGGSDVVPDVADAIEDLLAQSNKIQDLKLPETPGCGQRTFSSDLPVLAKDLSNPHSTYGISRDWQNSTPTKNTTPNTAGHGRTPGTTPGTYFAFSETQTDSQVVGYEEDLTGRQKIIDRVRSQSLTMSPDK